MSQGALRLLPVLLVVTLLLPGPSVANASQGTGTEDPFAPLIEEMSAKADALNRTTEAKYGANPTYKDPIASFRLGYQQVKDYNKTLLHGFVLNGYAKMVAAADYIEYREQFGYVNVPYLDDVAKDLKAQANATRARFHALDRSVTTLSGVEALIYASTYTAAGELQLFYYESVYRKEWLRVGAADPLSIPAVYGLFAMMKVALDYGNGIADLVPSLEVGPRAPEGALEKVHHRAVNSLTGQYDDGKHEANLYKLANASRNQGDWSYPVGVRILQIRAENITMAEYDLGGAKAPATSPAKTAAAKATAEVYAQDIPARFKAKGFAGFLSAEIQAEVGHYLNRSDQESLVRAMGGAAALLELPRLLLPLFPEDVDTKGSAIPMPGLVATGVAVAAVAGGAAAILLRKTPGRK